MCYEKSPFLKRFPTKINCSEYEVIDLGLNTSENQKRSTDQNRDEAILVC